MIYGNHEISTKMAVLGVAIYFLILLIATAIDIVVWRKLTTEFSNWLNIITMITLNIVFFRTLANRSGFEIRIFRTTSFNGIILAVGCAVLFYFLSKQWERILIFYKWYTGIHLWKISGSDRRIIFLNRQEHLLGINDD